MKYATIEDVSAGFRSLDSNEESKVKALITETGILVDACNAKVSDKVKKVVVCRIVRRAIGNGNDGAPMGATQGSMSALGYSQSWTLGNGSNGELYLSKTEKQLLGLGNRISIKSPLKYV